MYVSSYSTYLHTNTTDKTTNKKISKELSTDKLFTYKSLNSPQNLAKPTLNTPANYITSHTSLSTKAQIQQQLKQNNLTTKFTMINSQLKASSAYNDNSIMFSLITKNQPIIKQSTQYINQNLPQEIKDIKESFLKIKMINTYNSNNSYYQITA